MGGLGGTEERREGRRTEGGREEDGNQEEMTDIMLTERESFILIPNKFLLKASDIIRK